MGSPRGRVLVVDGGPSGVVDASTIDGVEVTVATSLEGARASLESDRPDCVVLAPATGEAVERVLSGADPSPPVIGVATEPDDLEDALDAGATDVVDWTTDHSARERLLERRVERAVSAAEPRDPRRALEAVVDGELVAAFDPGGHHTVAAGERFDDWLDPDRIEATDVVEAFAERPRIASHLDVNYAAAVEGETRRRELGIGDRTYEVETTPIYPNGDEGEPAGGLVRFRPAATDDVDPTGAGERDRARSKVHELREVASELETAATESEIFDIAVDSAERILEFDAAAITELEDGTLVPRAATAPTLDVSPERKDLDEGIAGKTIRTGEPQLLEDVGGDDEADPAAEDIGSALSVPVGERGVFQAVSTEPGTYDERGLRLAELLATHVANALERVRYQETITRERDNFAALYQNVPDAAVRYRLDDGRPRIESVNSAFVRLFGYEPDEAVGKTTVELLVPDESVEDADDLYESIAAGERVDREVRRTTAGGTRPFLLRSVPTAEEGVGYLIFTDLSELKRRERELARKNERLDRFASVVSHDLRNPLNVASGYLQELRETGDLSLVDEIEESHDRMFTIIDDVLTLARQGDDVSETDEVDLGLRAQEAWNGVDTGEATLTVEDEGDLSADPTRLRQLLENLFRNSVEHGGGAVAVTVGSIPGGFFVEDDGAGFPDTDEETLFDHGYTTAEDGTGLGLSIVEEIATAHGWTVSATEGPAGGARVEVHVDGE